MAQYFPISCIIIRSADIKLALFAELSLFAGYRIHIFHKSGLPTTVLFFPHGHYSLSHHTD